ncbi:putative sporulation protein YtxC [Paenibacillus sp. P96]|uniref:Sporulation protein YtxC n=1 Tax=Paenibacillus zeirhizosphaerae TaxID=2987519 RepID=A0ABT9FLB0_9BACL|nr:putative sporulation protein YtxC [Paenibacillus sp. P96]MDP4095521.1 putative sporulation protein YtxC [Paenibacillus sp. P96]
MSRYGLSFSFSQSGNRVAWTCKYKGREEVDQDQLVRVKNFMADAFAGYIQQQREPLLLLEALSGECRYMSDEETQRIREISIGLLKKDLNNGRKKRRGMIVSPLVQSFQEMQSVNLEGLLRFRLQAYKQELGELIEYALDEFWGERQYEEFVQLLKYFVFFQEHHVPLVHVIHKGEHNFTILDTEMKLISLGQSDPITVELPGLEIGMPAEDMILSNLISIAPARIMLHTQEPNAFVVHTLINIFENKVELCRFCPHCGTWQSDSDHLDGKEAGNYNNCESGALKQVNPFFSEKAETKTRTKDRPFQR